MEQTSIKKETSIDWLMAQLYKKGFIKEVDGNEPINLMNQAKEMEKQQQGYSEEDVEVLIKTTYEETMRAMVDWFINNKDKNQEEMESAIKNYVYPRLAEKGIKFKNK